MESITHSDMDAKAHPNKSAGPARQLAVALSFIGVTAISTTDFLLKLCPQHEVFATASDLQIKKLVRKFYA